MVINFLSPRFERCAAIRGNIPFGGASFVLLRVSHPPLDSLVQVIHKRGGLPVRPVAFALAIFPVELAVLLADFLLLLGAILRKFITGDAEKVVLSLPDAIRALGPVLPVGSRVSRGVRYGGLQGNEADDESHRQSRRQH